MAEIKVDKGFLDLKGARVAFSFEGMDLATLSRRKGDFSINFTIPDSKENRKRLDLADDDFLNDNITYQKIPATVMFQGLPVRQGYLKITGNENGIDAVFFSGNADWIDRLTGSIRDVDLSDYDHDFTALNIAFANLVGSNYVYPLIDYGVLSIRSPTPNSATITNHFDVGDDNTEFSTSAAHGFKIYDYVRIHTHNIAQYNGVFQIIGISSTTRFTIAVAYDSTAISGVPVALSPPPLEYSHLRPAVYVNTLMRVMFREIGWKLSGEVTEDFWYNKLIVPFSLAVFSHTEQWSDERTVKAKKNVSEVFGFGGSTTRIACKFWEVIKDDSSLWNGYQYTPHSYIRLDISASVFVSAVSYVAGSPPSINIAKWNGSAWVEVVPGVLITSTGAWSISETYYNLSSTEPVAIMIKLNSAGNVKINYGNTEFIANGEVQYGSNVDLSNTLPDISKVDFLRYIFNHRAIVPIPEPVGKTLELRFFKNIKYETATDWTAKVSAKTTDFARLYENYGKRTWFKYKDTSNDVILVAYRSQNGQGFGDGFIAIDNDFIENEKTIYEAPFAGTVNYFSMNGAVYTPYIPVSSNGVDFSSTQSPEFRILYALNNLDLTFFSGAGALQIYGSIGGALVTFTAFTFAFFSKTQVGTYLDNIVDESLAFDTPLGQTSRGLLERYYPDITNLLQRGKIETFHVKLSGVDLAAWSQGVPVFINYKGGSKLYFRNKLLNFEDEKGDQDVELIPYG